jgi:hypothetical protein
MWGRHSGWLSATAKDRYARVQGLLRAGEAVLLRPDKPAICCPACGCTMKFLHALHALRPAATSGPTRVLLDRGFTLAQAIDWMIQQGVVKPDHRSQFAKAMQSRITRLNQKRIKTTQQFSWQESLFFDSSHLVADGEMKAACGSRATSWAPARSESSRCPRCKGAANRHAIVSV